MQIRRRILASVLALAVLSISLPLTACSEDTVKLVKQKVSDLQIYSDAGLQIVSDFEAQNLLKPEQAQIARDALQTVKTATAIFIEHAAHYTKFDATSKADLYKLFVDVLTGARDFQSKAGPIITAALKAVGVANADQMIGKVSFIANAIVAAARVIESRLLN